MVEGRHGGDCGAMDGKIIWLYGGVPHTPYRVAPGFTGGSILPQRPGSKSVVKTLQNYPVEHSGLQKCCKNFAK